MTKRVPLVFLLVASLLASACRSSPKVLPSSEELAVRSFIAPEYPRAARVAGISGEVRLKIKLDEVGRIVEVVAVSGPKELTQSASVNIVTWSYAYSGKPKEVEVVYIYLLKSDLNVIGDDATAVTMTMPGEVIVAAKPLIPGKPGTARSAKRP